jgi:hypothetical protein
MEQSLNSILFRCRAIRRQSGSWRTFSHVFLYLRSLCGREFLTTSAIALSGDETLIAATTNKGTKIWNRCVLFFSSLCRSCCANAQAPSPLRAHRGLGLWPLHRLRPRQPPPPRWSKGASNLLIYPLAPCAALLLCVLRTFFSAPYLTPRAASSACTTLPRASRYKSRQHTRRRRGPSACCPTRLLCASALFSVLLLDWISLCIFRSFPLSLLGVHLLTESVASSRAVLITMSSFGTSSLKTVQPGAGKTISRIIPFTAVFSRHLSHHPLHSCLLSPIKKRGIFFLHHPHFSLCFHRRFSLVLESS